MQFMGCLYVGESISTKEHEIVKKVHNNQFVPNLYLLTFATNKDNMLEVLPEYEVLQKGYPKELLKVIGIANGKKEAILLVKHIVEESLLKTGSADVRVYLKQQWEGQACR